MTPKAASNVQTGSDSDWETVVEPFGESWDFNSSPVLIGTYLSSKVIALDDNNRPGEKRDSNVYEVEEASTGEKLSVWGTYAIDEAFAQIATGTVVRIEFQGKVKIKNGAQEVNQFVIQTKK